MIAAVLKMFTGCLSKQKGIVEQGSGNAFQSGAGRGQIGNRTLVEHTCLGFQPTVGLERGLLEAERASGFLNVGIGRDTRHTDGVMTRATFGTDGSAILERGRWLHPRFRDFRMTGI